jgi:hypothetical protein
MVQNKFNIASLRLNQIRKVFLHILLIFIVWVNGETTLPDVVVWANWFQKRPKIGKKFSRAIKQTWSCKERTWKRTFFLFHDRILCCAANEKRRWWPWGQPAKPVDEK